MKQNFHTFARLNAPFGTGGPETQTQLFHTFGHENSAMGIGQTA